MPYSQDKGQDDKVLNTGRIPYVGDGTNFHPIRGTSAGVIQIETLASSARIGISQREPFEFRPGATALSGGMVAAGTRSAGSSTTSGTAAASTYWSAWFPYAPLRSGLIDGLATGGVVEGQLTVGTKYVTGTGSVGITARIANTANTASPTTMLALTGTFACGSTAEVFSTYDIPYLKTDTAFNAVPFSVAIGIQHNMAGSTLAFRIMESSAIRGEMEPGT